MRKTGVAFGILAAAVIGLFINPVTASAKGTSVIRNGVTIGPVDVSGMTADEANTALDEFAQDAADRSITFDITEDVSLPLTATDLGFNWDLSGTVDEALSVGSKGNVISRYKEIKDIENGGKKVDFIYSFDESLVKNIISEQCTAYDRHAENASLRRENGQFIVEGGQEGVVIDINGSVNAVMDALNNWDFADTEIALVGEREEPVSSSEDLSKVKDLLGSFTTSFSSSAADRSQNVRNGCSLIDGSIVYPGEEFSAYDAVKPFTAENGYKMAGSYLSGMVVDSMGGGICQVSTTLYNAVLNAELEITERNNHSMVVTYVQVSADAAISESSGKDFRFKNNTDYPIYIEGITTEDKKITFNIYGCETRDPNRTVEFENEILQVIQPDYEKIIPDGGQGIGYVKVQGAHVGYKARLWKIVKVNGEETEREMINSSSYSMSPRTATVGVNTADPGRQAEIYAAIGTGSIDHVKNVAAALYQQEIGAVPPQ